MLKPERWQYENQKTPARRTGPAHPAEKDAGLAGEIAERFQAGKVGEGEMSNYFEAFIPRLPPGINRTYRIIKHGNGKPGLAKTPAANRWDRDAALIIGAAAGSAGFKPDQSAEYQIIIRWWGGRHDTDAHLKLVQDCVMRKLGFVDEDKQIKSCVIERCPADWMPGEPVGVLVYLFPALKRDWVGSLIFEGSAE